MIKFTKEEISLCKQVAEKHRKEVGKGDWYVSEDSDYKTGWSNPMLNINDYEPVKKKLPGIFNDKDRNDVPLWTIPNCLEFLRGEGYLVRLVEYEHYGGVKTITCYCYGHKTKGAFSKQGNKDEEACLKAVLVVLEEGK